ncbi:NAD(P)-binding protein [Priestia endophytica]|jgi:phytoene dehydrogenase-like protein|uniref:NAD(P)-binding protein n=1 Tax=Priestia endophytica TaxID=135735 RepID=UPI003D2C36C1
MENAIIIGGGIGGLTTGALLSKHGYKVIVLEAGGEVGGCDEKFFKYLFSFPVGATFGMGFEEEGIHNKILRYLGINVNIFPLSEAIRITGFSAPLSVFQNRTNHLK